MKFDLELFIALNEEYRSKPLVPRPPIYDAVTLRERGQKRAARLVNRYRLAGKRVLEIGCGRGETSYAFAIDHGCEVVGVDIAERTHWNEFQAPNLTLIKADLSDSRCTLRQTLGEFDFVYSNAVWEHLRHPFAMLKAVRDLLKIGGIFYLSTNLYRGPKASHLYREIFFPWPHLLFAEEIFESYYLHLGLKAKRPAWINRLSIGDYFLYFNLLHFKKIEVTYSITPIDEEFYRRFADVLERYPRFDLERDFLHAVLVKET